MCLDLVSLHVLPMGEGWEEGKLQRVGGWGMGGMGKRKGQKIQGKGEMKREAKEEDKRKKERVGRNEKSRKEKGRGEAGGLGVSPAGQASYLSPTSSARINESRVVRGRGTSGSLTNPYKVGPHATIADSQSVSKDRHA